jgi:hypothetical protein
MAPDEHTLSELSEADAPSHIRAIYRNIRDTCGVPMAALIFRHLATYPGVLEEIWNGIGPLLQNGYLQNVSARVVQNVSSGELLPPIEENARKLMGLTSEDMGILRKTLDAYNRVNPINLLTMLTLAARLNNTTQASPLPQINRLDRPTVVTGPLPPMTSPSAMTPAARVVINDFGFGDRSKLNSIVPSLFRHLTNWPAYLATIHVMLMPRFRDGSLEKLTRAVHQAMVREAAPISAYLPVLNILSSFPNAVKIISQFSSQNIPMMIVVGRAMRQSVE